ncbi:hypothetical protein KCU62_g214, partial [Aureobasidium sp. EXF-3399]
MSHAGVGSMYSATDYREPISTATVDLQSKPKLVLSLVLELPSHDFAGVRLWMEDLMALFPSETGTTPLTCTHTCLEGTAFCMSSQDASAPRDPNVILSARTVAIPPPNQLMLLLIPEDTLNTQRTSSGQRIFYERAVQGLGIQFAPNAFVAAQARRHGCALSSQHLDFEFGRMRMTPRYLRSMDGAALGFGLDVDAFLVWRMDRRFRVRLFLRLFIVCSSGQPRHCIIYQSSLSSSSSANHFLAASALAKAPARPPPAASPPPPLLLGPLDAAGSPPGTAAALRSFFS